MWRIVSARTRVPDKMTAESIIHDGAALIVLGLFIFAAGKGAFILGALVQAARLQ